MNFYTFNLESFRINNTRSRHDDTDTATFGLQVGTQQFPIASHFAGNLNNGSYPINLTFGPVLITESTTVAVFTYTIYNGGAGGLPTSLNDLGKTLLDKLVPLIEQTSGTQDGGWPNFSSGEAGADVPDLNDENHAGDPFDSTDDWSSLFLGEVVDAIGSYVFPDCDGFVAADGIGMSKAQWDNAIDSVGGGSEVFRKTMHYAGSNSPSGCGSNSDYTVTWSGSRETITGSLRQFLKTHGLVLKPGLRSLAGP